jgi:hypothetical protein
MGRLCRVAVVFAVGCVPFSGRAPCPQLSWHHCPIVLSCPGLSMYSPRSHVEGNFRPTSQNSPVPASVPFQTPIPTVLPRLSPPAVLCFLSCSGCPFLSWLYYPDCLLRLHCPVSPVPVSCPAGPDLDVLSQVSCSSTLVPSSSVPWLSSSNDLCPGRTGTVGSPAQTDFSRLSCPNVMSQMSCPDCIVMAVLPWLSCPVDLSSIVMFCPFPAVPPPHSCPRLCCPRLFCPRCLVFAFISHCRVPPVLSPDALSKVS